MNNLRREIFIPALLLVLGILALVAWNSPAGVQMQPREPGQDRQNSPVNQRPLPAPPPDEFVIGKGKPAPEIKGAWPWFRGIQHDGISHEKIRLARSWPKNGPKKIWRIPVCEGYAGPAIWQGRLYLLDYDIEKQMNVFRCLSLADGQEIWRYAYAGRIKRSHGITRTVPAVDGKIAVALDPKCHVTAVEAITGKLLWKVDLVKDYGSKVPGWYAGQCPLLEDGKVILAPGGDDTLIMALDGQTGRVLWTTPNPRGLGMTHCSIVPMELNGKRTYVYSAMRGTVAVSAVDGRVVWQTREWKIQGGIYIAVPLVLPGRRLLFSGGYGSGSMMMRIEKNVSGYQAKKLFALKPKVFGATQQSPIFYKGYIYGVRPKPSAELVCMNLDGKILWQSGSNITFGIGAYLLADGMIYAVDDSGLLRLIEAVPDKFNLLAEAKVLNGHDSWGPLAIVAGRLFVRDLHTLVCLDVK